MSNNEGKNFVSDIADIESDFPRWYTDVVIKTELVDYGPVKGSMVIRPYGYAIWENIQREMDERIKATGHVNAYFPMLIPYSYLMKEANHVEGFAPEVALVTHFGEEELSEKLFIRPTSETIIGEMYSKWINSYRDLPLLINQWANVFRCEKTTRPFLRTSEFLWQEGHTAHATHGEAEEETIRMLNVYIEFCKNVLAMPVLSGKKTEKEKFAGAAATYAIEAMMLDGKSLQAGTSHDLGQNFAKAFNITFQDKEGKRVYPYQSSWGVTTRLIGALIMAHGDKRGLILPPRVAPVQAVIIPVARHKAGVDDAAYKLKNILTDAGIRAVVDGSDRTPGWKFNEWEMKGAPLRIEIGPRDIENNCVMIARRDCLSKESVPMDNVAADVKLMLCDVHESMYAKALTRLNTRTVVCGDIGEMKTALDNGNFVTAMWCGDRACEDAVKAELSASARVMPFDQNSCGDKCVYCGKKAEKKVIFARAY